MLAMAIFQHQPDAGDAMRAKIQQMALHGR
jgi:hypothetical protein